MAKPIFVFGSNLAGAHGAGSARAAVEKYGAQYGIGVGLWGDSYAIPTKDCYLDILELDVIDLYVKQFIEFAKSRPDLEFNVVAIGCGLAGYTPEEIAPMFKEILPNVFLPVDFLEVLRQDCTVVEEPDDADRNLASCSD